MAGTESGDALLEMRRAVRQGAEMWIGDDDQDGALPITAIKQASVLHIAPATVIPLFTVTRFKRKTVEQAFDLASVYYAWALKDKGVGEYIKACSEVGLQNLSFVERGDLFAWLEGAESSEHIEELQDDVYAKDPDRKNTTGLPGLRQKSAIMLKILAQERAIDNSQTVMHGSKLIDFSSARKEANEHFLNRLRKRERDGDRHAKSEPQLPIKKAKRADPIIILSPSASSLITMHNVKSFLEGGVFVPPEEASRAAGGGRGPDLIMITRKSDRCGKERGQRFVIVEGVEKFKPEYWARVVCVFTTGQPWQFKDYKYSSPHMLFHNVRGVLALHTGEPVPPAAKDWNVAVIRVERERRHRDKESVEGFWEGLETWMEKRDRLRRDER